MTTLALTAVVLLVWLTVGFVFAVLLGRSVRRNTEDPERRVGRALYPDAGPFAERRIDD